MKRFFITSSGTGVGKTYVTALLAKQLRARGLNVAALKPVISGYDAADAGSDTALLMAASGEQYIERVSPWRFAAPLSPDMAAKREGKEIPFDALVAFCKKAEADIVLTEGVGGVMVPLNNTHTVRDWMETLAWPVILVGGTYLGAISHTLSAVEALRARGILLHALVLSESDESPVLPTETAATLARFLPEGLPIMLVPRHGERLDIAGICV